MNCYDEINNATKPSSMTVNDKVAKMVTEFIKLVILICFFLNLFILYFIIFNKIDVVSIFLYIYLYISKSFILIIFHLFNINFYY
jgi:hypothetical protein